MRLLLLLFLLLGTLQALPFSLITKEHRKEEPTLLVIGGIHGNEPGGYFAPALLSQYYTIEQGNLWIVPDLNRPSIQADHRGVNGDMNRKFADCPEKDPDYSRVDAIKKIMTDPQVSLILNLHDGHGFYRKERESTIFNPNAWGQTCVIDQCNLDQNCSFGELGTIARKVSSTLNTNLLEEHHAFNVKNTQSRFEDEAMRHSLTYFAVTHHKPAFAIETSKNLASLAEKVYYQLRAIEAFMKVMDIRYRRSFDLTEERIARLLEEYGTVSINDKITLDLKNIRNSLSFVPLEWRADTFRFTHPLGSVKKNAEHYVLYIGNKIVTKLRPERFGQKQCMSNVPFEIDGSPKNIQIASGISVNADFKVKADGNVRVNIIGYSAPGRVTENENLVRIEDLDPLFSIDRTQRAFRVELYEQNEFCGMVTVRFK